MPPVSPLHTPPGPMSHDPTNLLPRESNASARPHAGRHLPKQFSHEFLEMRLHVRQRQLCSDQAHAAVDVVSHTTGRDDTVFGVERRDTSDRKSIAPMPIRHTECVPANTG